MLNLRMIEAGETQNTCSSYVWMRLKTYLLNRGVDEATLVRFEKTASCYLADELRYRIDELDRVIVQAGEALNDPLLGLASGMHFQALKFGLFHSLLGQVDTLKKGIELSVRYLPLESQAVRLAIRPGDSHCELIIISAVESISQQHLENLTSQIYHRLIHAEPKNVSVQFSHSALASVAEYEKVLGCPVRFDQDYTAVVFDRKTYESSLGWKDQAIFLMLERMAKKRLAQLMSYRSTSEEVRFLTRQQILFGEIELSGIASFMGVSERSLQKLLHAEGSNYREILGQVRGELALELLHQTRMPAIQIAEQLGFEEVSSFYRFFRRVHGKTVAETRAVAEVG